MAITISGLAFHTRSFSGAICNAYADTRASDHLRTATILSRIGACVTNNNGFWVRCLDLLALLCNYEYNKWLSTTRSIPYWTTSIFHCDESLLTHWTPLRMTSESEFLYEWRFTANQSVLATSPLRLTTSNFIFQLNTCGYSPYLTLPLWREAGSVVYNRCWSSPAQSFTGASPAGLITTFYCLRFGHPQHGGPGPRIYIPYEQRGPSIPPGTGFPFRRLLRLRMTSLWRITFITSGGPNMSPSQTVFLLFCVIRCLVNWLLLPTFRRCLPTRCLANGHTPSCWRCLRQYNKRGECVMHYFWVSLWVRVRGVLRTLTKYHEGKSCSTSNKPVGGSGVWVKVKIPFEKCLLLLIIKRCCRVGVVLLLRISEILGSDLDPGTGYPHIFFVFFFSSSRHMAG
jgi:hypothetical protein